MPQHPLVAAFQQAGQGHVFAHYDQLPSVQQAELLADAGEIDLAEIAELNRTLVQQNATSGVDLSDLAPAPYEALPKNEGDTAAWAEAKRLGEAALRAGRVAAFVVAGGQGTRLGYDGPKGTYPVTPMLNKTLFNVFADKLRAAGLRYGRPLHWFIMTSHINHAATEAFFHEHAFFGLAESHVHFFRQGRMPAVGFNGKILLEDKHRIAMSPDGHGGSLRALQRSGALDLMEREGIDILSYFQVDNPLVRFIDPAFVGWHVKTRSEMSSKMVPKAYAGEKVGHFCAQSGKTVVIEYSDLPKTLQEQTDAAGKLRFIAGSIAIHLLDRDFIRRMATGADSLPFHRADKKIPCIDDAGALVKPEKPNGVKFELFVFDALPFAQHPVVIETDRADDFSPVKNADGLDSPKTCAEDQLRQFVRWANANGAAVPADDTGLPAFAFEVSPLFGYDEDSFAASWSTRPSKPVIAAGVVLD